MPKRLFFDTKEYGIGFFIYDGHICMLQLSICPVQLKLHLFSLNGKLK